MALILLLLLGTLVGWLTAAYAELDEGIFVCMLAGALGGLIGGRLLPTMIGSTVDGLYKILLAIVGAVICSQIARRLAVGRHNAV